MPVGQLTPTPTRNLLPLSAHGLRFEVTLTAERGVRGVRGEVRSKMNLKHLEG